MTTIPQRKSRTQEYDLEEDESYYTQPAVKGAIRYTQQPRVVQRGNKRIIIHDEPPPKRQMHWSFVLGLGMILTLVLWIGASYALNWWNNHQLDSEYGMPRTAQYDFVVGHMDSLEHPTHFVAINLHGKVTILEIPGGNSLHARISSGPTLVVGNGDTIPITLEFEDSTGDGKIDMIVHIGDQKIIYLNDGTQFKPQQ